MIKCQKPNITKVGYGLMRYFITHYKAWKTNHFHKISKSKNKIECWRRSGKISRLWSWRRSVHYAQRRHTTHWASSTCVKLHARYALGARYTLCKRTTHTNSELKFFASSSRFMQNCLQPLASRFFMFAQWILDIIMVFWKWRKKCET